MRSLIAVLRARNLTDLWSASPLLLIAMLQKRLGITEEAMHEWLCDSLGCRCSS